MGPSDQRQYILDGESLLHKIPGQHGKPTLTFTGGTLTMSPDDIMDMISFLISTYKNCLQKTVPINIGTLQ